MSETAIAYNFPERDRLRRGQPVLRNVIEHGGELVGVLPLTLRVRAQRLSASAPVCLLTISRWGRWVDGQAGGGEAAVDEVGSELDSA
ncbi:hypothetical protein, partial [Streptomyces sp. NPDC057910]|uniref:hypothetical protein n=1 Tax=Streptomyces sp. NPDC057910 TaxID=3346278 RepID=UPI0036E1ADF3